MLFRSALAFRTIFPHDNVEEIKGEVVFSDSRNFKLLDKYIKGPERFEHLLQHASGSYLAQRKIIARTTYGDLDVAPIIENFENQTQLKFAS